MRPRMLTIALTGALILMVAAPAHGADFELTDIAAAGSFSQPLYATSPPGDASRVFVVQQAGKVRLVKDGAVSTFLDLTSRVNTNGESGLLSIAFAPDYATSGLFYVFYTDATSPACQGAPAVCDDRVAEFHAASPDVADDPATHDRTVLVIPHHKFANHHGGQLQFGPDGDLYIATGDGGSGGDPDGNGQNLTVTNGKLLRIDPRQSGSAAYTSPGDNPFATSASARHEIWAYGLRNPWRFSFDAATHDLVLPDVGQGAREEINLVPAGTGAGANFGWSTCEGEIAYPSGGACSLSVAPYVPPVLTYRHDEFSNTGDFCGGAVIGGAVVRDLRLPADAGRYVYGDYCHQYLWTADLHAGGPAAVRASVLDTGLGVGAGVTSIGQDSACRIYVTSSAGWVRRIDPAGGMPAGPVGCAAPAGAGGGGALGGGLAGVASGPPAAPPGPGAALPGPGAAADVTPPVLSRVGLVRDRFAVAGGPTAIRAVARGTAFRFRLSEGGVVTIRLERARLGRRVGRRCLAAIRARRHRPGCTRLTAVGTLTRRLAAGARSVPFSGRIGRRALLPSHYRATINARDVAGNVSRRHGLRLTIVAG